MKDRQTHVTIRVSEHEKQKLRTQAKKMNLNTSKFVREYFIKLISDEKHDKI